LIKYKYILKNIVKSYNKINYLKTAYYFNILFTKYTINKQHIFYNFLSIKSIENNNILSKIYILTINHQSIKLFKFYTF